METSPPPESAPLSEPSWRGLRTLVHCLAVSMLILTGTVFVFLYRQVVSMRKSTAEMSQYLKNYENSEVPEVIDRVRERLDAYRQQDPNFTPIFVKYFGSNRPAGPSGRSEIAPVDTNAPVTNREP